MSTTAPTTMPPAKPLTLIVATTSALGIGRAGALPWPSLKGEMSYFARITKRAPTSTSASPRQNAVIMGRKTWESIPSRFRPLKGRANLVVSNSLKGQKLEGKDDTTVDVVGSLQEAVDLVQGRQGIDRVFVIGGSSIYAAALRHEATERVLLTKIVRPEYECDTFFPVDLEGEEGWRRGAGEELQEWTGEEFGEEGVKRREGEVEYEFCLFEKRKKVP